MRMHSGAILAVLLLTTAECALSAATHDEKLLKAVKLRDLKKAEKAINVGGSVNFVDQESGKPVLMIAVETLSSAMVALLLQNGADPNLSANYRWTSLMAAVATGRLPIIEQLLAAGANVNAQDAAGSTALRKAALMQRQDIISLLLRNGADLKSNNVGTNLLVEMLNREDSAMARLLIESGVDVLSPADTGEIPLDVMFVKKNYDLLISVEQRGLPVKDRIKCKSLGSNQFFSSPWLTGCYDCGCALSNQTRLVWSYPTDEKFSLNEARREVNRLNETRYLGRNDWRIPSLSEQFTLLDGPAGPDGRGFPSNHPFVVFGYSGTVFYWNSDVPEPKVIEYNGLIKGREIVMDRYRVINFKYRDTFLSNYTHQRLWVVAGPLPPLK